MWGNFMFTFANDSIKWNETWFHPKCYCHLSSYHFNRYFTSILLQAHRFMLADESKCLFIFPLRVNGLFYDFIVIFFQIRHILENGSLYFPKFDATAFRQDVHWTVYKCVASNAGGTIISRDLSIKAGKIEMQLQNSLIFFFFFVFVLLFWMPHEIMLHFYKNHFSYSKDNEICNKKKSV